MWKPVLCRGLTREKTLAEGANALLEDYLEDEELTAFTALDIENFYETKL